jgi:hypothetical protein
MQPQLFCATCAAALAFEVPDLTRNRWHALCKACGNRTALVPNKTAPEELVIFNAAGVHSGS